MGYRRGRSKRARLDPLLSGVDSVLVACPFSNDQVKALEGFLLKEASGWSSARDHEVNVSWSSWAFLQDSPWAASWKAVEQIRGTNSVTRYQLVDLARECRAAGNWVPLMLASYPWGMGTAGYGPARLKSILQWPRRDHNPVRELNEILVEAVRRLDTDPIYGYAYLRGQQNADYGTADGARRVPGWGPAFFTKFLYFASESLHPSQGRALILDKRVADTLRRLTLEALDLHHWEDQDETRVADADSREISRWAWADGNWWTGRYRTYLDYVNARHDQIINEIPDWTDDPAIVEVALWKHYPKPL